MMSSTCSELEGSPSGRRLNVELRYNYGTVTFNRLPEDELSSSEHVEDII